MGLLDDVMGQIGAASSRPIEPGHHGLARELLGMLAPTGMSGGLVNLVNICHQRGLGDIVNSWISTGQNLPITAEQVRSVLGRLGDPGARGARGNRPAGGDGGDRPDPSSPRRQGHAERPDSIRGRAPPHDLGGLQEELIVSRGAPSTAPSIRPSGRPARAGSLVRDQRCQSWMSRPSNALKSDTLRVTRTRPLTRAMAAIWPSANGGVLPRRDRRARSAACASAA